MRSWCVALAIFFCASGCGAATPPSLTAKPATIQSEIVRSPIGTNLEGLDYWSTELPFVDVFRTSSPWISGHADVWDDERRIDIDSHGWVKSLARGQIVHTVLIASGIPVPVGKYVVEYEGEGEIAWREGAQLVERSLGRDIVEIDPGRGNCILNIVSVNPKNYLRNIHVRMRRDAEPNTEAGETRARGTFNPAFLENLRGYKVLRFMIWMLGVQPEDHAFVPNRWPARPTTSDARWSARRGPPVEIMVELSNRTGADPWFTIPHLADDEYVRRFAELVRDSLRSDLKVYIEHSNEVWNPTYASQNDYARARGLALGLSTDPNEAMVRYHARRTAEIGRIFDEVLGSDRVLTVLAEFAEMPEVSEHALGYDSTSERVDALSIAPYFGYELGLPENEARVSKMTLDELFREIETRELPRARDLMERHAEIARRYALPLIAYEGGQHLRGEEAVKQNERINALFDAANRDPRMGRIYTRYLSDWNEASGAALFVNHLDCGGISEHGRWGLLEYLGQPRSEAPKYDAVMKWMEETK